MHLDGRCDAGAGFAQAPARNEAHRRHDLRPDAAFVRLQHGFRHRVSDRCIDDGGSRETPFLHLM